MAPSESGKPHFQQPASPYEALGPHWIGRFNGQLGGALVLRRLARWR